jgi:quercetin dioxygenase-like cupin family protein
VAKRFEDERGVIEDLLDEIDAVTWISTKQGAVRGNHIHHFTTQWVFIVSGCMRIKTPTTDDQYWTGSLIEEKPGIPHAWQAVEDTQVLVFTRGPRSGENYESDTERLEEKLIECPPHA